MQRGIIFRENFRKAENISKPIVSIHSLLIGERDYLQFVSMDKNSLSFNVSENAISQNMVSSEKRLKIKP